MGLIELTRKECCFYISRFWDKERERGRERERNRQTDIQRQRQRERGGVWGCAGRNSEKRREEQERDRQGEEYERKGMREREGGYG